MNGEKVRQARELRGLTQAQLGELIGANQSMIAHIESERFYPSDELLQRIASETGFSLPFFKQTDRVPFPAGSLLFRAKAKLSATDRACVHRWGQLIYELIERMLKRVKPLPMNVSRLSEEPREAARLIRSALGLSPDTPIGNLINTLERAGVVIIQLPIRTNDVDAFSLWAGSEANRPVIVIMDGTPACRLRLSVAHELGHLVLHWSVRGRSKEAEKEAMQFASELLIPEEAARQEIVTPVTLSDLAELKLRWRLSIKALVVRAHELGIITKRQYHYLCQQLTSRWGKEEPGDAQIPVERPHLFSQLVETVFGVPLNVSKVANELCLPVFLTNKILESHGRRRGMTERGLEQDDSGSGRVVSFPDPLRPD